MEGRSNRSASAIQSDSYWATVKVEVGEGRCRCEVIPVQASRGGPCPCRVRLRIPRFDRGAPVTEVTLLRYFILILWNLNRPSIYTRSSH